MKVICSYCRKYLPDKEPLDDNRVSHTVCADCYVHFKEQWDGLPLESYLEKFKSPVIIMDDDCRVIAANKKAADLTGRKQREVTGLLGGEALECAYSRLPRGCGKTVHCETCTIRNTVNRVLESGDPQSQVPVKIRQEDREIDVKITADKIGDLVRIVIEV